jgi:transposase
MIVIGADVHKSTHALAAVDAATGQLLGERAITAREQGHLDALRWAHELGQELVWAIEDCRNLSHHLEQALIGAGERVLRVAPKLMGASRRGEREPGKSDQIDARAIARAVLREGVERFPSAFLDQDAAEIRLLCDHRDSLVNERTRLINRLRINLVILDPELEAKVPSRKLDYPGQLQRITRRLRAMPQTARVRIARQQVKRIDALTREAEALKRELRDLIRAHRPELLAETGCGPLCAAILIGQTAGAERFASDAHFARIAGVAPIPVSSGRHDRHRLDRGGNRQLNRALHIIAITRGRIDPATRAYLARKEAEGKSRIEAMRCLKRHLARHYHRLLLSPLASASNRHDSLGVKHSIPGLSSGVEHAWPGVRHVDLGHSYGTPRDPDTRVSGRSSIAGAGRTRASTATT